MGEGEHRELRRGPRQRDAGGAVGRRGLGALHDAVRARQGTLPQGHSAGGFNGIGPEKLPMK